MNDQSRDLRGRLRAINIGLPEKENRVNGRRSNIWWDSRWECSCVKEVQSTDENFTSNININKN